MREISLLIAESNLDRAELLHAACEDAAPEIAAFRFVSPKAAAWELGCTPCDILLASVDSASGMEPLLRALRMWPEVPVIALLAEADPAWESRLLVEGAIDVLPEAEIEPAALVRRIRLAMTRHRLRESSRRQPSFPTLADFAMTQARQAGRRAAIARVRLDGLMEVVEAAGVLAADSILLEASELLAPVFPEGSLVGSVTYGDFAALTFDIDPNALRGSLADAAVHLRQRLPADLPLITCRFGFAESRGIESVTELLDSAAAAMCENVVALAAGS